jgi:hypothetical protein
MAPEVNPARELTALQQTISYGRRRQPDCLRNIAERIALPAQGKNA